jgi:hypothetical protein
MESSPARVSEQRDAEEDMTNFYWLAMPDRSWHDDTVNRMNRPADRILPFEDGTSAARTADGVTVTGAEWTDVQDGDFVWIPVHGRKKSTDTVAWVVKGVEIDWTAEQLAFAIRVHLFGRDISVNYHLLACFGANNIIPFSKSFGAKFAKALTTNGMRGTLTAYKGATGMAAQRGMQVGSGRFTAAPIFLFHRGEGSPAGHIATQSATESWPLYGTGGRL